MNFNMNAWKRLSVFFRDPKPPHRLNGGFRSRGIGKNGRKYRWMCIVQDPGTLVFASFSFVWLSWLWFIRDFLVHWCSPGKCSPVDDGFTMVLPCFTHDGDGNGRVVVVVVVIMKSWNEPSYVFMITLRQSNIEMDHLLFDGYLTGNMTREWWCPRSESRSVGARWSPISLGFLLVIYRTS